MSSAASKSENIELLARLAGLAQLASRRCRLKDVLTLGWRAFGSSPCLRIFATTSASVTYRHKGPAGSEKLSPTSMQAWESG